MTCDRCKELEAEMETLNANIEDMFVFAFAKGFQIGTTKAIEQISKTSTGALESGLFPDLARMSMKEYFKPVYPCPSTGDPPQEIVGDPFVIYKHGKWLKADKPPKKDGE